MSSVVGATSEALQVTFEIELFVEAVGTREIHRALDQGEAFGWLVRQVCGQSRRLG